MQRRDMAPPVREGEEYNVRIEALGEKGDGIARVKGFVLFVDGVKQGETCRVKVTKVLKKVGFAQKVGAATEAVKDRPRIVEPEPAEPSPEDSEDFGESEPVEETTEDFSVEFDEEQT